MNIGGVEIGPDRPTYIIAEAGINHNGQLAIAEQLVQAAEASGADCIKFQKRNPERAVPENMREVRRDTPWGEMSYLNYKHLIELDEYDYSLIDSLCRGLRFQWSASVWDEDSVDFLLQFKPPFIKIPSAMIHNIQLLERVAQTEIPTIVSTATGSADDLTRAVELFASDRVALLHSVMIYPAATVQLNLRKIITLRQMFPGIPIGYSGHETGIWPPVAAVALGACIIERHLTLDRAMWGSDQAASMEPHGFQKMVNYIRELQDAFGNGEFLVHPEEIEKLETLYGDLKMEKLDRADMLPQE